MPPAINVEKRLMDSRVWEVMVISQERARLLVTKKWRLILDRCRIRLLLEAGRFLAVAPVSKSSDAPSRRT